FDQAILLNPSDAIAYINRGLAYRNLKDYPRAIADYDQAIQLNPNYATAYINRGIVYADLKDYPRACQDFKHAIELDPKDINAAWMAEWAGMGKIRPGIETAEQLEKIASIDPQSYL